MGNQNMNSGRAKKVRQMLNVQNLPNPKLWNRSYKVIKKGHKQRWLKANVPNVFAVLHKKRRKNEDEDDFKRRRKKSNQLKRMSRKGIGLKKMRRQHEALRRT
jgi:hypothetical protein